MVSIIMTVYNREKYLTEAIRSVIGQDHRDWELIIWDDGSTDRSLDVARQFERDSRIKVYASHHQGRAISLASAHALAEGEAVGWLDSDDILEPKALSLTALSLTQNPQASFVYTQHRIINEDGTILGIGRRCKRSYTYERMLRRFCTYHFRLIPSCMFEKAGSVDTSYQAAIDYDLCLRLVELAPPVHLQAPLYRYRIHGDNMSTKQREVQRQEAKRAVREAKARN